MNTGIDVNAPIWVDVARTGERPLPNQPSFVLIDINKQRSGAGPDYGISIWLMTNAKPKIIDWESQQIEDMQSCPVMTPGSSIRLGIMPCCGRIVFNFNGGDYVYTKKNKGGGTSGGTDDSPSPDTFDFKPSAFQASDIAVFGTNCQAILSVNAMSFSKGILHAPFPGYDDGQEGSNSGGSYPTSDIGLLKIAGDPTTWGACASNVPGNGDPAQSEIFKNPFGEIKIDFVQSKNRNGTHAKISLIPGQVNIGGDTIQNGGPPFFGRMQFIDPKNIKGVSSRRTRRSNVRSSSSDVLSVNINFQAPDSYHAIQTAEVTFYNEGGRNNSLIERSHGIKIGLGWGSAPTIFTGVTLGGYRSETAGMETITVNCQDYMYK